MLKRILVLDDNQDILDMVNEVLTYENFEVRVTTNGANIIDTAKDFDPHLAILDYRLMDSDGIEVCRELRAHPQFKNLPVILFSAYVNAQLDFQQYGYDDIITKPFNLSDLIDKVNKHIKS